VISLLEQVQEARPELDVYEAFVDVQRPRVDEVVAGVEPGRPVVVVPLLLTVGYHTRVDIARAVRGRSGARAAAPLGPDRRLVDVLVDRLMAVGWHPDDALVVGFAGSSDPDSVPDTQVTLRWVSEVLGAPATAAYGAAREPSLQAAVAAARKGGADRVALASYLLAPGHFESLVREAGADVVSAPLGADPRLVEIALDRFDAALAGRSVESRGADRGRDVPDIGHPVQ
jgi:sirohydrochlorin ferrochelatase